jgi:hypothetical protein
MNYRMSTAGLMTGAYSTRWANRSSPIIMVVSSLARPFVNPVFVVRLADPLTGVSRPNLALQNCRGLARHRVTPHHGSEACVGGPDPR